MCHVAPSACMCAKPPWVHRVMPAWVVGGVGPGFQARLAHFIFIEAHAPPTACPSVQRSIHPAVCRQIPATASPGTQMVRGVTLDQFRQATPQTWHCKCAKRKQNTCGQTAGQGCTPNFDSGCSSVYARSARKNWCRNSHARRCSSRVRRGYHCSSNDLWFREKHVTHTV